MSFNILRLLVAGAVAAVVAGGGTAFTAGNGVGGGHDAAGYGSATVSGATTEVIEHSLSADGTSIASTALTFTTDLGAGQQVKAGFGSSDLESCVLTVNVAPAKDTAVCTYSATYATSTAAHFRVAVS